MRNLSSRQGNAGEKHQRCQALYRAAQIQAICLSFTQGTKTLSLSQ